VLESGGKRTNGLGDRGQVLEEHPTVVPVAHAFADSSGLPEVPISCPTLPRHCHCTRRGFVRVGHIEAIQPVLTSKS